MGAGFGRNRVFKCVVLVGLSGVGGAAGSGIGSGAMAESFLHSLSFLSLHSPHSHAQSPEIIRFISRFSLRKKVYPNLSGLLCVFYQKY